MLLYLVHSEIRSEYTCNQQYYVNEWAESQTNKCTLKLTSNYYIILQILE